MPSRLTVDTDAVLELYASGLPARQVAKKLRISPQTILRRLRESSVGVRSSAESRITAGVRCGRLRAPRIPVENTTCGYCGKPLYRTPHDLKRAQSGPACSARCKNKIVGTKHLHTKEADTKRARTMSGEASRLWNGGRHTSPCGYVYVYCPGHPRSKDGTYVAEHVLVMETKVGRHLNAGECVHHLNRIKDDNRPENLVLCSGVRDHMDRFHPRKKSVG